MEITENIKKIQKAMDNIGSTTNTPQGDLDALKRAAEQIEAIPLTTPFEEAYASDNLNDLYGAIFRLELIPPALRNSETNEQGKPWEPEMPDIFAEIPPFPKEWSNKIPNSQNE